MYFNQSVTHLTRFTLLANDMA